MGKKKAKRSGDAVRAISKVVAIFPPECPHCGHQKFTKSGGLPETVCHATGQRVKRSRATCQGCGQNYILKEIYHLDLS